MQLKLVWPNGQTSRPSFFATGFVSRPDSDAAPVGVSGTYELIRPAVSGRRG